MILITLRVPRPEDRLAPALAAVALAALFMVGCGQGERADQTAQPRTAATAAAPRYGGVLTLLMNQTGDPPSFDLHQESASAAIEAAGPAYDGLIGFDPLDPESIVPELAERWEVSPDGLAYTFYLRRGVRFQNGNPLTAADVKFSLERVKSPPSGIISPRRDAFRAVAAVETPDDYTVRVSLARANPSLLANLAQGWIAIYDREWVEARGQEAPKREAMGSGPYRMREYLRGASVEVERNPDYWMAGRPYLERIKHFVVPDPATRLAAFRTGQVMASRLYPEDARQLRDELGSQASFHSQVAPSFGTLTLNSRRRPFDDPRVREAINLAIDRYAALLILSQGDGEPGGYLMPGGAWSLGREEVLRLPGYAREKGAELERARTLLAEAGYAGGFETELLTRSGRSFVDLSVFAADQLKRLNVTAKIVPMETGQAFDLARRGDYQVLTWGHEFALDDPDAVYGEFYVCGGSRNWSGLCTPEVDALFDRQSQELDLGRRKNLVQEMERRALASHTKINTHWNRRHDGVWGYVKGYRPHPSPFTNVRYREVWLAR